MYRWLETFEQRHVEFQRYILYCQSMSRIWTSAANDISVEGGSLAMSDVCALRARGLRQAAIFDDLKHLALRKFSEVVHPAFFHLEVHLAVSITDFRKIQLGWMSDLDIIRADLVGGLYVGLICSDGWQEFGSDLGGMYSHPVPKKHTSGNHYSYPLRV